jgi:ADP-ribose pyrophosphatase
MATKGFEVLRSETAFVGDSVYVEKVTAKVGSGLVSLETVRAPMAVAVLGFTGEGRVVMERQYRHSLGRRLYEVPAGTVREGEDPASCAARELEEETGYAPLKLRHVGTLVPSPGLTDEIIHLFVAKVGRRRRSRPSEDEIISVHLLTVEDAIRRVLNDGPADAKSVVLLQMAKLDPSISSWAGAP